MTDQVTHVYDQENDSSYQLGELHDAGVIVLCPKCRSPLIIALDEQSAILHKVHPGVYCPVNSKHINIIAELPETRKAFQEWMNKITSRDASVEQPDPPE